MTGGEVCGHCGTKINTGFTTCSSCGAYRTEVPTAAGGFMRGLMMLLLVPVTGLGGYLGFMSTFFVSRDVPTQFLGALGGAVIGFAICLSFVMRRVKSGKGRVVWVRRTSR